MGKFSGTILITVATTLLASEAQAFSAANRLRRSKPKPSPSPISAVTTTTTTTTRPSTTTTTTQPVAATTTPTTTQPSAPTTTTMPSSSVGTGDAIAFGIWNPTRFDTCTKAEHDSYWVLGPDGKRYPTWHPPVHRRADGSTCSFGHEHGRNPAGSLIWDMIRRHFAYDANRNGVIESSELAVAGLPFGYVNEQLDLFSSNMIMRHEDHVGHKVDYGNGEPDMNTDQFDTNPTGGVVVPLGTGGDNPKFLNSGVRCYYFAKVHQGVHSKDAFTNNLHEVFYASDCRSSDQRYVASAVVATLMQFGKFGEFTNSCDAENDRISPVVITTDNPMGFPGFRAEGSSRTIVQRGCIERNFLVPQGTYSMNLYEAWPGSITLKRADGTTVATGANLLFDVLDPIRYYRPGALNNVGYAMDLCYEVLDGRQSRGGQCDWATNYRSIQGITWDDPRSAFRGLHRGMYFFPLSMSNAGGSPVLYTDPFGGNASSTPFPGSVKQSLSQKNVNYLNLGDVNPRVLMRQNDDGGRTVHAPN